MRIDGLSEENPTQKVSIKRGDIVINLGDRIVNIMMIYMRVLSIFDKGNTTRVIVKEVAKILRRF